MYDLISFGGIAIDLYYKGASINPKNGKFDLVLGDKYVADEFYECLGGGAANVAVNVASHGFSAAVCAKVGLNVFKQFIIQKLLQKSVSIEFLQYDEKYMNISSILLSESGERTVINYPTPNESIDLSDNMKRNIVNAKMVYMGNLPDISVLDRAKLLELFGLKNVPIVLNMGTKDCVRDVKETKPLLDLADILIINTHEYSQLVKKPTDKINFREDCAKEIKFDKKTLIITDGERGSYGWSKSNFHFQKIVPPEKIVDTTGAGDAYVAGFIAAYLNEKTIGECMENGATYSSKILAKIGAS